MNRKAMAAVVIPFVLVFSVGGGIIYVKDSGWLDPPCHPVDVDIDDIDLLAPCVRVAGMAHYGTVVRMDTPANLFHEEKVHYLYPLFPPYDTESRAVNLLIRSPFPPENLVNYELMVAEGRLLPYPSDLVPWDVEIRLGKTSDYFFQDGMLILDLHAVHPYPQEEDPEGRQEEPEELAE